MAATILIIDDEAAVREGMAAYLSDSGFDILQAKNGDEGLALFHESEPSIVLCDLKMPGVSGLDVLQKISDHNSDIPVMMISGVGNMNDVVSALRLGACDFHIKPIVDMEVLEHAVNRILTAVALQRENEKYRDKLEETVQMLRSDQQAGLQVQLKMLPQTPKDYNYCDVEHRIIPSLYLSGDFVDYFRVDENSMCFYLADVSGHGASSAFVTVLLKTLVNRLRRQHRHNPEQYPLTTTVVMDHMNKELLSLGLGKHVTMFCGLLDKKEKTLTYSVGAHFPSAILYADGKARYIKGSGLPLGLFDSAEYKQSCLPIPDDFKLLVFSDGILEVMKGQSIDEKEEQLLAMVDDGNYNVAQISEQLSLDEEKDVPDDIAILAISGKLNK